MSGPKSQSILRLRPKPGAPLPNLPRPMEAEANITPSEGLMIMPGDKAQNLQDVFLNYIRKNKVPVTIFLINGVKLQGVINSFDNFCLLLRRDGHVQLVYKHAVSTVMPSQAIRLYEPEQAATPEAAPAAENAPAT